MHRAGRRCALALPLPAAAMLGGAVALALRLPQSVGARGRAALTLLPAACRAAAPGIFDRLAKSGHNRPDMEARPGEKGPARGIAPPAAAAIAAAADGGGDAVSRPKPKISLKLLARLSQPKRDDDAAAAAKKRIERHKQAAVAAASSADSGGDGGEAAEGAVTAAAAPPAKAKEPPKGGGAGLFTVGDHGPCSKCGLPFNLLALITSGCGQIRCCSSRVAPRSRDSSQRTPG